MTTTTTILNQKHKVLEGKLSDYNTKVREGASQKVLAEAKTDLDNALKAYNEEKYLEFREKCKEASNPVMEALTKLTYNGERLKAVSSESPDSGLELVVTKFNVDLIRFCDELEIKRAWKHDAMQFYRNMAVKAAFDMGYSVKEATHVYTNLDIGKEVEKVLESKGNPNVKDITSTTQLKALLQRSLDEVLGFEPDAETPYIVTGNHINAMLMSCCRLASPSDKRYVGKPTLKFLTQRQMMDLVASAFNLAITKGNFTLAYKSKDEAKKATQSSEVSTSETVAKAEPEKVPTSKKVSASKKKASTKATTETTEAA